MKKFLIVASLGGFLAACNDNVPMLSVEDGGNSYVPPRPVGEIFYDPTTGYDTIIFEDGIFF